MRLLVVSETLDAVGGAERLLTSLSTALAGRGHRCDVVSCWGPYTLADELEPAGIRVHRLDMTHRRHFDQAVPRLARVIRHVKPDVIHAHLFFPALYTALTRPLLPRPARVVTFHNMGYDFYPPITPWLKVRRQIEAVGMRRGMSAHIGVSMAVAKHYAQHLRLPAVPRVIPNAVPIEIPTLTVDCQAVRSRYRLPSSTPMIVCGARLRPQKGHRYLLLAVDELRRRHVDFHLVIAGDGPERANIDGGIRDLDLGGHVTSLGRLPHAELLELISCAQIAAIASTNEGLPVTALEAMSVRTALVATAVGGLPEVVDDGRTGLLVPPRDPHALADRLEALLADAPRREELADAGFEHACSASDIEDAVQAHERFYASISRTNGRPEVSAPGP
jgi:glycosyltransferase involved in cell wall biosynthesis